jgi:hypothetical protein
MNQLLQVASFKQTIEKLTKDCFQSQGLNSSSSSQQGRLLGQGQVVVLAARSGARHLWPSDLKNMPDM